MILNLWAADLSRLALNAFAVIEPDLIHKKKFDTVSIFLQFFRNISKPRILVKIILKTVGSHEKQTDIEKSISRNSVLDRLSSPFARPTAFTFFDDRLKFTFLFLRTESLISYWEISGAWARPISGKLIQSAILDFTGQFLENSTKIEHLVEK